MDKLWKVWPKMGLCMALLGSWNHPGLSGSDQGNIRIQIGKILRFRNMQENLEKCYFKED